MSTSLWLKNTAPKLWGSNANNWNAFDASHVITPGANAIRSITSQLADVAVSTGANNQSTVTSVAGATAGLYIAGGGTDAIGYFSPPVAADVTISGTVTFDYCMLESSMNANATMRGVVYLVDEFGALTLIVDQPLGTEVGTANARSTWTGTPTSTLVKRGHRLLIIPIWDDATATTMGSGFTLTLTLNGTAANTGDSKVTFTETITFDTTDPPPGTQYFLRDTASDLGGTGQKALNTVAGTSTTTNAVFTTVAGPIALPGQQWTKTAGGSIIEWFTPKLSAFTLGGYVRCVLGMATGGLETNTSSPFDTFLIEIAVTDASGGSPAVWGYTYAKGIASSTFAPGTVNGFVSGPDLSVADNSRLRVRVYSEDWHDNNEVSGTNRTLQYDGASASNFYAYVQFSQTITEAPPASDMPYDLAHTRQFQSLISQ